MNRRKWPITIMQVGESFVAQNPPKRFAAYVAQQAMRCGKKFKTRRVEGGRFVQRVA